MTQGNLYSLLPKDLSAEVFETLVNSQTVKIERIISKGQVTPKDYWYEQSQHEWVMVVSGAAKVSYDNGEIFTLAQGDYLNIPAQQKHQVVWTAPDQETIWLAVHYDANLNTSK